MELLVSREATKTGVDIWQDGEYLRAASSCCGFVWKREGIECVCRCGIFRVKAFLHQDSTKLEKGRMVPISCWIIYWTGLKNAVTEVRWDGSSN